MLTPQQLASLDRLEKLAAAELVKLVGSSDYYGIAHNKDYQMLSKVAGWVAFVKDSHDNKYCNGPVKGCLINLRRVARRFNFQLEGD